MGCIDKKISELTNLAAPAVNDLLVIVDVSVAGFETKKITVADFVTGGIVAPADAQYVTMAAHAGLPNERVLTGTANQVIVTDGGAGGPVTLSTPQDIGLLSTPTFGGLTINGNIIVTGTVDGIDISTLGTTVTNITNAPFVTMALDATLANERVLTGTANQITVTDGGAGGNATISLPSDINLTGASSIGTTAGNLTLDPTGNIVLNSIGGTIDIDDGIIDLSTQVVAVTLNNATNALNFDSNTLIIDALNNRVGIGVIPAYHLSSQRTFTDVAGTNYAHYFFTYLNAAAASAAIFTNAYYQHNVVTTSGSVTGTQYSARYWTYTSGANNVTAIINLDPAIEHYGSGTLTYAWCLHPVVIARPGGGPITHAIAVITGVSNSNTNTITNAKSIEISSAVNNGGGAITNNYGIFINSQTVGVNDWAIYTNAGLISFGDNLQFRQDSTITTTAGDLTLNPAVDINVSKVLNFDWAMGNSTKDPTSDAPDDWVQVEIADAVYYLPAYVA